jgi:hypothetical protein
VQIVDNTEYDRQKEAIALARQRSKQILSPASDEDADVAEAVTTAKGRENSPGGGGNNSDHTQEDSGGLDGRPLPHNDKIRAVIS